MRKFLAFLLTVILCLSAVGCRRNVEESQETAPQTTAPQVTPPATTIPDVTEIIPNIPDPDVGENTVPDMLPDETVIHK